MKGRVSIGRRAIASFFGVIVVVFVAGSFLSGQENIQSIKGERAVAEAVSSEAIVLGEASNYSAFIESFAKLQVCTAAVVPGLSCVIMHGAFHAALFVTRFQHDVFYVFITAKAP